MPSHTFISGHTKFNNNKITMGNRPDSGLKIFKYVKPIHRLPRPNLFSLLARSSFGYC